jgi:hypothetical protein
VEDFQHGKGLANEAVEGADGGGLPAGADHFADVLQVEEGVLTIDATLGKNGHEVAVFHVEFDAVVLNGLADLEEVAAEGEQGRRG